MVLAWAATGLAHGGGGNPRGTASGTTLLSLWTEPSSLKQHPSPTPAPLRFGPQVRPSWVGHSGDQSIPILGHGALLGRAGAGPWCELQAVEGLSEHALSSSKIFLGLPCRDRASLSSRSRGDKAERPETEPRGTKGHLATGGLVCQVLYGVFPCVAPKAGSILRETP